MQSRIPPMQVILSCVVAPGRRDRKEPSKSRKGDFPMRHFLLLTYLVVTASTDQLCLMTQDEIRERKLREAQETRERLRIVVRETKQNVGTKNSKNIPQTLTSAKVKGELEPSKRPPQGGWTMRVSDCPHAVETRAFRENAHLEWIMRGSSESHDRPGRHSDEEGSGCDTAPLNGSMSRMWKSDAL